MRNRADIKLGLLTALQASVDNSFAELGFRRGKGATSYQRRHGNADQIIDFDGDYLPSYQSGAEVHIYPSLLIRMQPVSEMALKILDGNRLLLADAPEIIVNQPVAMTAPSAEQVRWFATGDYEILERVDTAAGFIKKWTIPLLEEIKTPNDLVHLYESDDSRVLKQRHWYVYVAAAALLQGDKEKALTILNSNLGAPAIRKRYAAAFDAVSAA